jgi:hypothetical protein
MTKENHSSDFERRLAEALAGLAEPAPPGLVEGVHRRHQRHLRRARFSGLAVAVVLAGGALATHAALSGSSGPARGGAAVAPAVSSPPPAPPSPQPPAVQAAPGTELRDCSSANGGTLSADWRSYSEHAGPVWLLLSGRIPPGQRNLGPLTRLREAHSSALVVAVANGHTAVVTVAPRAAAGFRFLPNFGTIPEPPLGSGYTLGEGKPGLTLGGCDQGPPGSHVPAAYVPGLTQFWEGYVSDLRGCIPLEVRTPGGAAPVRAALPVNGGHCPK